jgi:hypothetical protein
MTTDEGTRIALGELIRVIQLLLAAQAAGDAPNADELAKVILGRANELLAGGADVFIADDDNIAQLTQIAENMASAAET